jgi:hypothetical protein
VPRRTRAPTPQNTSPAPTSWQQADDAGAATARSPSRASWAIVGSSASRLPSSSFRSTAPDEPVSDLPSVPEIVLALTGAREPGLRAVCRGSRRGGPFWPLVAHEAGTKRPCWIVTACTPIRRPGLAAAQAISLLPYGQTQQRLAQRETAPGRSACGSARRSRRPLEMPLTGRGWRGSGRGCNIAIAATDGRLPQ